MVSTRQEWKSDSSKDLGAREQRLSLNVKYSKNLYCGIVRVQGSIQALFV